MNCSEFILSLFPKPCFPRKRHRCRICDEFIEAKEPCCRWQGFTSDGPFTSHAHPECYNTTKDWDDLEMTAPEGPRVEPRMYWTKEDVEE